MKYDLTSDLVLFLPVIKVEYSYTYKPILYFKHIGLKLICQGMWVARARKI